MGRLYVSKPQDKLYSLMHLAIDYEDGSIEVDYAKTCVDVMMDAAAYHVRSHGDLRFLLGTFLMDSNEENENQNSPLLKPTWLPGGWLGVEAGMSFGVYYRPQTTRCSPHAVNTTCSRLRARGMRIDQLESCLIDLVDGDQTPRQFWDSSMGLYLRDSTGIVTNNLSDEAFKVLFGPSGDDLSGFAERIMALDGSGSNMYQHYFWGHDKERDLHMFVIMKAAAISGLAVLLELSQDPQYADLVVDNGAFEFNTKLVDKIEPVVQVALYMLYYRTQFTSVIMTELGRLGRVPLCNFQKGDEIWFVLGIDHPVVLRPQPNGYCWHICAAQMPSIIEHEDIRNLSSDIQPGDRIGDWVVEDVEIE